MVSISLALTREETGWLRQHPELLDRAVPIAGLVSAEEIATAKHDWHASAMRSIGTPAIASRKSSK
jgi:hypothetical protein